MLSIRILVVGKLKEKYIKDGCDDYFKRLSRFCNIEIVEVKDFPDDSRAMEEEATLILPKIKGVCIPLCIEGKQLSSEELAGFIDKTALEGNSAVTFIIGGSRGLSDRVKSCARLKLSFSKMTFPHGLMRMILLEQLYRGFKILNNENYHK